MVTMRKSELNTMMNEYLKLHPPNLKGITNCVRAFISVERKLRDTFKRLA
jgi:hypothetical protein